MQRLTRLFAPLAFLLTLAAPAGAQGWIEPGRPIVSGRIERVKSTVDVQVTGRIAHVTVEDYFHNSSSMPLAEATYLYPLPGEAVFSGFSLWQGDQELTGETMDAAAARAIYEEIVRRRRDPALIELAGHGLVRARVFPIQPGETRRVTLRYTEILDREGDAWRFRFTAGSGDPNGSAPPLTLRLAVDSADRFGEPYSPTQRVTATREGGRLNVAVADSTWRGDLEIFLPLARGLVGTSLLTYSAVGEDPYFMLLLSPGRADGPQLRRDVALVLDISGSMSGDKIDQAKRALTQTLQGLRQGDRFRLVAFSNEVRRYAPAWTDATPAAIAQGVAWAQSLAADGGTNIAGALAEAFAQPPAEGALGVAVFLTDGLPTAGETDPERIVTQAEQTRGGFRVFAFGIGNDVNTYLLDRLTERAHGATQYIEPGGDIERAVGALTAKISTPVLTDLALDAGSAEVYDLQPGTLPDLFGGEEMVVFGRVRGAGSGKWALTVRGRRASQAASFTATADSSSGASYIAQLWAARKAGALSREIRLHGATTEIAEQLKHLALRYGILTEYTSYLVQEPQPVAVRRAEDRALQAQLAPGAQSGAGAIARSRKEADLATASVASPDAGYGDALQGHAGIAATERRGGRLFILRDSVWSDLAYRDSSAVVKVAPFSAAYFDLLHALPELAEPAALAPAVLVAGKRVSVEIVAGGLDALDGGRLADLVKEFR